MKHIKHIGSLGSLGSVLSIGCAIHCMLLPLAIAILPATSAILLKNPQAELGMLCIATVISVIGLCWGFPQHQNFFPVLTLSIGVFILMKTNHSHIIKVLGSLCFLISNILNKRLCKNCTSCSARNKNKN